MIRRIALTAAAFTTLLAGSALAKCTVTLRFTNANAAAVTALGSESQVRVNGGTWSKMNYNNVTIQPLAVGVSSWTTNMSCGGNAKRDFRFKYRDSADNAIYQESIDNIDVTDGMTLNVTLDH